MKEKNNTTAYLCAGFTIFLWASAFPGVKYALNYFSPGPLMLFRFSVATATLFIISFIKKIRLPAKEDALYAAAGGTIGIFGYMLLFNMGTGMVKSGISSFLIATAPIFTMILSAAFLKETVILRAVIGVGVSAFGLLLIAISQIAELSLNYGILLLLLAAVSTSAYNIIQRKISFKYSPIECTTYSIAFATILMLVFLPQLLKELPNASLAADAIVVYMGVFPAALAYLSWNYALAKADKVTYVTNFLYLIPFIATTLSFAFLGEVLSPLSFAGGFVIIAGMVLSGSGRIVGKEKKDAKATS